MLKFVAKRGNFAKTGEGGGAGSTVPVVPVQASSMEMDLKDLPSRVSMATEAYQNSQLPLLVTGQANCQLSTSIHHLQPS